MIFRALYFLILFSPQAVPSSNLDQCIVDISKFADKADPLTLNAIPVGSHDLRNYKDVESRLRLAVSAPREDGLMWYPFEDIAPNRADFAQENLIGRVVAGSSIAGLNYVVFKGEVLEVAKTATDRGNNRYQLVLREGRETKKVDYLDEPGPASPSHLYVLGKSRSPEEILLGKVSDVDFDALAQTHLGVRPGKRRGLIAHLTDFYFDEKHENRQIGSLAKTFVSQNAQEGLDLRSVVGYLSAIDGALRSRGIIDTTRGGWAIKKSDATLMKRLIKGEVALPPARPVSPGQRLADSLVQAEIEKAMGRKGIHFDKSQRYSLMPSGSPRDAKGYREQSYEVHTLSGVPFSNRGEPLTVTLRWNKHEGFVRLEPPTIQTSW